MCFNCELSTPVSLFYYNNAWADVNRYKYEAVSRLLNAAIYNGGGGLSESFLLTHVSEREIKYRCNTGKGYLLCYMNNACSFALVP